MGNLKVKLSTAQQTWKVVPREDSNTGLGDNEARESTVTIWATFPFVALLVLHNILELYLTEARK